MANPSNTVLEVEANLRSVIQSLIDGQEGFQKFGDELKDPALKQYFLQESLNRAQFRGELETVLHHEGVHDVKESGTVAGAMRRTWGNLKSAMGASDHSLLETAEQSEDAAVEAYSQALNAELPLPIRQLISTQSAHIQHSHDFVKAARDNTK
jgi:uncharacterized protein (TIGR02284 family)